MPVIGLVAALIVLTQLIEPPPLVHDASRRAGGFLALVGSLILVAGGVLARRESVATSATATPRAGARCSGGTRKGCSSWSLVAAASR